MPIIKWDPLERTISDLMDDFPLLPIAYEENDLACDVYEQGGSLVVVAALPGIKRESLSVRGGKGVIHIFATREQEKEDGAKKYYFRKEVRTGSLYRAIFIPFEAKTDAMEVDYVNGMLVVRMPYASTMSEK